MTRGFMSEDYGFFDSDDLEEDEMAVYKAMHDDGFCDPNDCPYCVKKRKGNKMKRNILDGLDDW